MRIKEVEMVGFKSFVDKTRFSFDEGIIGVVGPNGCGKSNIVDALRWTMGEMSAKSLRGADMQDVIFNGTETRKPMGMAQVSILFDCSDGRCPTGYEGVSEIQITRRLYRSGESEYLLNRRPCRLKDIIDLFLDTGVGARTYSIIEQGQIARVISAKPLERRVLIEDAAGISKYRVKRDEALRKIDATQTNLNRVNDVLFEIKRNLNSLQRQAAKARRYHEFKGELRELDLELGAREKRLLAERAEQVQRDRQRLTDLKQETAAKLDAAETRLASMRLEVLTQEKAINQAGEKVAELREAVRQDESRRELLSHDINHLEAQIAQWQEETAAADGRIDELSRQATEALAEIEALAGQIEAAEAQVEAERGRLGDLQQRRRELDQNAEAARGELLRLASRQASLDRAVQGHRETVAALEKQLEENAARQAQVAEALAGSNEEQTGLQTHREELEQERVTLSEELTQKTERLERLKEAGRVKKEEFAKAKDAYDKTRVRLESLEEMRRNLEGYQYGVKKVLEAAQNESGGLNGSRKDILGVLADQIDVPKRYETALEAVLGERLQAVLVRHQDAGAGAVEFLKSTGGGRGSFVPMTPRTSAPAPYPEHTLAQSLGPLAEHVSVEESYQPVADTLLANVLVVEDLPKAIELHRANGFTGSFVTLDGEVIDNAGVITGGQVDAVASGILQKKREIAELTERLTTEQAVFEKLEKEHYTGEGMIARLQDVIAERRRALDDNRLALAENAGELRRAQAEAARLTAERETLEKAADQLHERRNQQEQRHAEQTRELGEINQALAAAQGEADEKAAAQKALTEEIDTCQKAVTEATLHLGDLTRRRQSFAERHDGLLAAREDTTGLVARRREQITQARESQDEHRRTIGTLTGQLQASVEKLELAEKEAVAVREGVDEKIGAVEKTEQGLKLLRRELDGHEQELHNLDLTASQIDMKREHLAEKLMEKYEVGLDDLAEPADQAELETEALKARVHELNQRIGRMGEVNPNAVEEYEEQKERFDHYETQKLDLEEAIAELKKAIAKINKTSRERFVETFNLVNHKFGEVMPLLFGGGTAKLVLTEPDNPLESGLDIVIRPPGKKLTNVNLLSGGEKAMASIGLIFSIFLIKPSPFCLLDEVDAPLDDANIYRFNELVEKMAAHSQVILITHNKSTMEVVDTLYGITMQEKGVSKLVGVQLDKQPAKH